MLPEIASLEKAAGQLDYYEGQENADGMENFMENFGGDSGVSWQGVDPSRVVRFNLTNSGSNAVPFYIHVGHRNKTRTAVTVRASGGAADTTIQVLTPRLGVIRDGSFLGLTVGASDTLTGATQSVRTIEDFINYAEKHSLPVNAIDILSTNATQLQTSLIKREINPYQDGETKTLTPSDFTSPKDFQTGRAQFKTPGLILHGDLELQYQVLPSATVTIALFMGPAISSSQAARNLVNPAASAVRRPQWGRKSGQPYRIG
jgi:hypothetical protein